ncbi:MAG: hypothetical protein HFG26_02885 [Provencibacterium sp.]|jgi:hypothetical protein|nr:hypothetical protein [Provencibacterium sp.]
MRALCYLAAVRLKNGLLDWLRRPARLITVLMFAALLVFSALGSRAPALELRRPLSELGAIVFLLYTFTFVSGALQGLQTGASFYSMADVHFLFPAPISPRRVLLYGLIRQAGSSLFIGFFLLYQYSWLHSLYGVSMGGLLVLLTGYGLCIFCSQLTAMVLYSFTSQNESAQRTAKAVIFLLCALTALGLLPGLLSGTGDWLALAAQGLDSLWVSFFPVAGWVRAAVMGFLGGNRTLAIDFLLLCGAYIAALLLLVSGKHPDFYEDVLLAAEVSQSAVTAKKEGRVQENLPRRIRVGKTGIRHGAGAGVFYYKHRLEDRRSQFFLLDSLSLFFLAFGWGMAWLMREEGPIPLLVFTTYLQLFSTASGRWVRELLQPYVYLLPEPAALKLFHICRESMLRAAVEAAALYLPAGLILGLSPAAILACFAFRMGFAFLFLAGNLLIERVLGTINSRVIIMTLYFLILILLGIPGIILAVALYALLDSLALALWASCLFNLAVSALTGFLCRNMLDCAEMNNW